MKKRGISPLIATVLIIGAVIGLSAVLFIWGGKFTESTISQTEFKISKSQACYTDLELKILEGCYNQKQGNNPGELIFRVENKRGVDLGNEFFLVRIHSNDKVSQPIPTSQLGEQELSSLGIKNFKVNYDTTKIDKFELIPQVKINNELVFCENIFEFNNIKEGC